MVSLSSLKTIANKKDSGSLEYEYVEGLWLKVRPLGNKAYDKAIQNAAKSSRKNNRRKSALSDEAIESINKEAAAKHILIGWRGLTDDEGNELDYSPEIAERLFNESYQFFKDVMEFARQAEVDIREAAEARLGNSSSSSNGSSNSGHTPKS